MLKYNDSVVNYVTYNLGKPCSYKIEMNDGKTIYLDDPNTILNSSGFGYVNLYSDPFKLKGELVNFSNDVNQITFYGGFLSGTCTTNNIVSTGFDDTGNYKLEFKRVKYNGETILNSPWDFHTDDGNFSNKSAYDALVYDNGNWHSVQAGKNYSNGSNTLKGIYCKYSEILVNDEYIQTTSEEVASDLYTETSKDYRLVKLLIDYESESKSDNEMFRDKFSYCINGKDKRKYITNDIILLKRNDTLGLYLNNRTSSDPGYIKVLVYEPAYAENLYGYTDTATGKTVYTTKENPSWNDLVYAFTQADWLLDGLDSSEYEYSVGLDVKSNKIITSYLTKVGSISDISNESIKIYFNSNLLKSDSNYYRNTNKDIGELKFETISSDGPKTFYCYYYSSMVYWVWINTRNPIQDQDVYIGKKYSGRNNFERPTELHKIGTVNLISSTSFKINITDSQYSELNGIIFDHIYEGYSAEVSKYF